MTPPTSATFIEALRSFADGRMAWTECSRLVDRVLLSGPQIIVHDVAEPDVVISLALDAAFYLDFVLDDGPLQELEEARVLAGALAVLLTSATEDDVVLPDLMQLARWKDETSQRIGDHLGGRIDRGGFERFIARRPWPAQFQHSISVLSTQDLVSLAKSLFANDWTTIRALIEGRRCAGQP